MLNIHTSVLKFTFLYSFGSKEENQGDLMKKLTLIAAFLFSTSVFAEAFRAFECDVTHLTKTQNEELNLTSNSSLTFIEKNRSWSLEVENLKLSSYDLNGPAMHYESDSVSKTEVGYFFYSDLSLEYQLDIDVKTLKAKLYWWGLGERIKLANLACTLQD